MIDGFRYGFFGQYDVAPAASFAFVAAFVLLISGLCLIMLAKGYKIRA